MAAAKAKKPLTDEQRRNKEASRAKSNANLRPFVKGDPRINRDGRPKDHNALRRLIQRIAGEAVDGKPEWSQIELMLRAMMKSKQPSDRKEILEHGWGKVPQQLDVSIKDVDDAIERELARLAGSSQAEDAGAAAGTPDSGDATD